MGLRPPSAERGPAATTASPTPSVPTGTRPDPVHPDLVRLLEALHGPGARVQVGSGDGVTRWLAVPDTRSPRFLLPDAPGRTIARLLLAHAGLRARDARLARRGVATIARAGLLGRTFGTWVTVSGGVERSFPAHLLATLADHGAAHLALGTPAVDHHYKPTVQVVDGDGHPVGFAKLGWTQPTADLVRAETVALAALAGSAGPGPHDVDGGGGGLRAPRVLDAGLWNGQPYLVTSPLPDAARRPDAGDPRRAALATLATAGPPVDLLDTGWGLTLLPRLEAVTPDPDDEDARDVRDTDLARDVRDTDLARNVRDAIEVLLERAPRRGWHVGRLHGDWAPWNVADHDGVTWAFDWEHSRVQAPVGLDELHWRTTAPFLLDGRPFPDALRAAARDAAAPTDLVLAYLVELGLRSLALEPGPPTGTFGAGPGPARTLYPGLSTVIAEVTARALGVDVQHEDRARRA